jgi:pRiA4b ORF-3-like protein
MRTRIGDIYQLKITLKVKPAIWRRLEVPATIPLSDLHLVFQIAMGWQNGHLHEFRFGDDSYGAPDPELDLGRPIRDERRARLNKVISTNGLTFVYMYDYGDRWHHAVVVEAINPPEPGAQYPRVTKGARACPPEDVGGPWGYGEFLDAIADPLHEEHEQRLSWIGGSFDPEAFDLDETNERMKHPEAYDLSLLEDEE